MDKEEAGLSPEAKQKKLFESWLAPQGIDFISSEAEKAYWQWLEQMVIPSQEAMIKMEADREILAGGDITGRRSSDEKSD